MATGAKVSDYALSDKQSRGDVGSGLAECGRRGSKDGGRTKNVGSTSVMVEEAADEVWND